MMETLEVKAASDHLSRIGNCAPLSALEELLWNSCDADATLIRVRIETNELGGVSKIVIDDNGSGIEYLIAKRVFSNIGGSPKAGLSSTPSGRLLHGKEGRGRYKAVALGSRINWTSRTKVLDGSVETFKVTIEEGSLAKPVIEAAIPAQGTETGCTVEIQDARISAAALLDPEVPVRLATRFASYLRGNPDIRIEICGQPIDATHLVWRAAEEDIEFAEGERLWKANVSVYFWNVPGLSETFYCRNNGAAVEEIKWTRSVPTLSFSVYIASDYFDSDTVGGYSFTDDLDPVAREFKEKARRFLRKCAREALAEQASATMDDLRTQGLYPYVGEPATPMERAEREVFDIAAAKLVELSPYLKDAGDDEKRVKLQVLKVAIEEAPSARDRIIREVFRLGDDDLIDFADLLNRIELSSLVSLARTVTGRMDFLEALHLLAYKPSTKKRLLERSQLHKIILRELWMFGEQYTLGRSDNSLKNILREHLRILGRENLDWESEVPENVRLQDIPDLMLFRMLPAALPGHYEHLIIELKRPGQNLGWEQFKQIMDYAGTVAEVGAFDKTRTKWKFVVVSSEADAGDYKKWATGKDKPAGLLGAQDNYEVWAFTWGTLIQDARHRMEFIREALKYDVDDKQAAEYLVRHHGDVLAGKRGDSPILGIVEGIAADSAVESSVVPMSVDVET